MFNYTYPSVAATYNATVSLYNRISEMSVITHVDIDDEMTNITVSYRAAGKCFTSLQCLISVIPIDFVYNQAIGFYLEGLVLAVFL